MRSKVRLAAALLGGLSLAALGYGSALAAHGLGGGDVREGGHAMGGAGHAGPMVGGSPRGFTEHGSRGEHFAGRERFGGREHFAEHGNFDHFHRHRVFRNGVWVWVYGPGYAYSDCGWLLRRAEITGSPYWWNRYRACEYGYY
jgi:hypothetical protein